MSLALNPLKVVKVYDPRVDLNAEEYYADLCGGAEVTYKPFISTSYSNSSASFTCPPPNPSIIVDKTPILIQPVQFSFTGDDQGRPLLQQGYDAPRSMPLARNMATLQVTPNNTTASIILFDVASGLFRYHNQQNINIKDYDWSMTPSALDMYQNYQDGIGSNLNPLGSYASSTAFQKLRGSFAPEATNIDGTAYSNTNTSAKVTYIFAEPLFLSPFSFGHDMSKGFIGLQTLDIIITWNSDLAQMWSHGDNPLSTPPVFNSVSVTLGQPTLMFKYITPKELFPLPKSVSYPYYIVDRYPTTTNASVAVNDAIQFSSSNIQLQSIPRRMYIYARQQNQYLSYYSTDTFMAINNISLNWNNRQGLLSSASQQDLYKISVKNGYSGSWEEWSGYTYVPFVPDSGEPTYIGTSGSVLCLEFGTDIGLRDTEAPGMLGTYQLQINVNCTNCNQLATLPIPAGMNSLGEALRPTLYIVVVSEGIFTIENNRSIAQIGVISKDDILNSQQQAGINYNMVMAMQGAGDFFGKLKRISKDVVRGIKKYGPQGMKIADRSCDVLGPLDPRARAVCDVYKAGKKIAGIGGARKGRKRGGVLLDMSNVDGLHGSGLMSRDELIDRLGY